MRPVPGPLLGPYPQRADAAGYRPPWRCLLPGGERLHRFAARVAASREAMNRWRRHDDAAFADHVRALRARLAARGLASDIVTEALACAAVAGERTLGHAPFDRQLHAALALLDGCLAEMATGEGKTLAIALAAAVAGIAGIPVHVLTANDYLVRRDAERMTPLFLRLGLDTGAVTTPMTAEQRAPAWAAAITYVTARELVFDYLRDGMCRDATNDALAERARALAGRAAPLLRGLCLALIDEADSILIDEARTPLILSRPGDAAAQRALLWQATNLAHRLEASWHFTLDQGSRTARLTAAGHARLEKLRRPLAGPWKNSRHAVETIELTLTAHHFFERDKHYLVRNQEIVVIDPVTGRVAEGRQWSRGLHGLIALKEGCPCHVEPETLARIAYQRFFRRYLRLGGISGTLTEARGELARTYGLPVVRIPPRLPSRRTVLPSRGFRDEASRKSALVARLLELTAQGRAVLVGTDSVSASEEFSIALTAAGISHVVLNARNEADEAAIVAQAGSPARVTVATRMAGRGTDITLHPDVAAAGGLHVINCQRNDSARLDRQLAGRCARQGDRGSTEHWLICTPQTRASHYLNRLLEHSGLLARLERQRQQREQHWQALERHRLLRHDEDMARQLAFAGPME